MSTTIDTPEGIAFVQLLSRRGALRLELKGLRKRGRSAYSIAKEVYGLKGSREKVLEQLNEMVDATLRERREKMTDISGLEKHKVIAALYNAARPQGMGMLAFDPEPMSDEEAHRLAGGHLYFDYVKGRVLKVNLEGQYLDPQLYDRDNGKGAAEVVIELLRITDDPQHPLIMSIGERGLMDGIAYTESLMEFGLTNDETERRIREIIDRVKEGK